MEASEDDSALEDGPLPIRDVEFMESPIAELCDGCSVLKERCRSNALLSFVFLTSWMLEGLGDNIFMFDSD